MRKENIKKMHEKAHEAGQKNIHEKALNKAEEKSNANMEKIHAFKESVISMSPEIAALITKHASEKILSKHGIITEKDALDKRIKESDDKYAESSELNVNKISKIGSKERAEQAYRKRLIEEAELKALQRLTKEDLSKLNDIEIKSKYNIINAEELNNSIENDKKQNTLLNKLKNFIIPSRIYKAKAQSNEEIRESQKQIALIRQYHEAKSKILHDYITNSVQSSSQVAVESSIKPVNDKTPTKSKTKSCNYY
ncbi:MAG: hypothetical protein AB8B67_03485 [Rickettsiaceae bacterium]